LACGRENKPAWSYHAGKLNLPQSGRQNQKALKPETARAIRRNRASTLAGLETLLRLVDDVDAALATHQAIVAMAIAQGLEGIADFHGCTRISDAAGETHGRRLRRCYARIEPGDQGSSSTGYGADEERRGALGFRCRKNGKNPD
jgi:hypothetical protein